MTTAGTANPTQHKINRLIGALRSIGLDRRTFTVRPVISRIAYRDQHGRRRTRVEHGEVHAFLRTREARLLAAEHAQALAEMGGYMVEIIGGSCGHPLSVLVGTGLNPRRRVTRTRAGAPCLDCGTADQLKDHAA